MIVVNDNVNNDDHIIFIKVNNDDDQFTKKTAIPRDKFLDQVHLVLTTT